MIFGEPKFSADDIGTNTIRKIKCQNHKVLLVGSAHETNQKPTVNNIILQRSRHDINTHIFKILGKNNLTKKI
jgi:hypothetical protein